MIFLNDQLYKVKHTFHGLFPKLSFFDAPFFVLLIHKCKNFLLQVFLKQKKTEKEKGQSKVTTTKKLKTNRRLNGPNKYL
jgi:hypothetical protein